MPHQTNTTNFAKALSILFTALLAGQIIFAVLAFVLIYSGSIQTSAPELENIFFILVPALIIAGRLAGTTLYKKKVQEALNTSTIQEKLNQYKAAFITRCALLEGPVLFAIIAYFITSKIELLAFAAGGILLFVMMKPVKEKIANELNIGVDEI
ncbi:MAG TPA: hypothetical protein PLA68_07235 [Panacibacter sp.]|nr:hypothetical protein [Panacibacter sp.]